MIYVNIDTEGQKELKAELKTTQNAKWYRRLKALDLSADGHSAPKIAAILDLHGTTVRGYIKKYNQGGLANLSPHYRAGRPQTITWDKEEWLALIHQAPSDFAKLESGARNWTQEIIQRYFAAYQELTVTRTTISKTLKRVGIAWRRAKLTVKSPDPMYIVKRSRINDLKKKALTGTLTSEAAEHPPPTGAKKARLVFFDSTDLHWCPDIGAVYNEVGEQIKVPSPGYSNPWYALFGSLQYPSGEGVYTIHTNKRHQEVAAHIQLLIDQDPDAFWFVVSDNASAHTTPKLEAFRQKNTGRLELVFLPTYSPNLNLIERLWRFMRGQMTRNHFYPSLDNMAEAIVNWLEKLPFSRFCSLMGLEESQFEFVLEPFSQ